MTRKAATNSGLAKVAVQWLNQSLCCYQSLCLVDSEVLRNRNLRVATKRHAERILRTNRQLDFASRKETLKSRK